MLTTHRTRARQIAAQSSLDPKQEVLGAPLRPKDSIERSHTCLSFPRFNCKNGIHGRPQLEKGASHLEALANEPPSMPFFMQDRTLFPRMTSIIRAATMVAFTSAVPHRPDSGMLIYCPYLAYCWDFGRSS